MFDSTHYYAKTNSKYRFARGDAFANPQKVTCLSPPVPPLPPVRSIEMSDVTAPPPAIEAPPPVFRIVVRMEFSILP
jgi:hypothetical protein